MRKNAKKNKSINQITKDFGLNLKAERNRADLTQEQLAEKIGASYAQVVGTIERGEVNTSLLYIVAILNALDIDFDKLIDRKRYKNYKVDNISEKNTNNQ